ncbi:MAG: signal transduction histidine kinase regulating citrate/malate metabolism [Herbinix sp.]|jgi:hypothetical protein|nr:signal transduction histidine kinase regulating citrate/malate metabolism [Herbinix sp.]
MQDLFNRGVLMLNVLSLMNYGLIFIFGLLLSVMFAGVDKTKKNRNTVLCIIVLLCLVQIICWRYLGYESTVKIYPIIIHIPLTLLIAFYFKRGLPIAFVSVLCAYLCCQTPQWFATVSLNLFDSRVAYFITNSLVLFPVFYLLKRYVVASVNRLMNLSRKSLVLFGIIPLFYYLFDYTTTIYTDLLYQGIKLVVLFMPAMLSMFYFVFINFHYNEIQRRSNAENETMLLSVQMRQAEKDLNEFWEQKERTAIYHHDMRHHLNLIAGFLKDGDTMKVMEYINQVQSDIIEVTPVRYCENNTVNLILSYYTNKAESGHVTFTVDAQVPQNISITETELCALLSNSLENAFNACTQIEDSKARTVHFICKVRKEKLLISIENSFAGMVIEENGLPKSDRPGHGFGTKSMVMIINKYSGYYTFTAKDGIFTLRILLPLTKINNINNSLQK